MSHMYALMATKYDITTRLHRVHARVQLLILWHNRALITSCVSSGVIVHFFCGETMRSSENTNMTTNARLKLNIYTDVHKYKRCILQSYHLGPVIPRQWSQHNTARAPACHTSPLLKCPAALQISEHLLFTWNNWYTMHVTYHLSSNQH